MLKQTITDILVVETLRADIFLYGIFCVETKLCDIFCVETRFGVIFLFGP